jgi:lysophospholipase L1-like esterase
MIHDATGSSASRGSGLMKFWLLGLATVLCLSTAMAAQPAPSYQAHWISVWGCSAAEPFPHIANSPIPEAPRIQGTVRYRIPVARLGTRLALRITNEAGTQPLVVASVSVGVADAGVAAHPGTLRSVTFGSRPGIVIPAGAPAISDPIETSFGPARDLVVSLFLPESTQQAQSQSGMLVESVDARDATMEVNPLDMKRVAARPLVSAIYVDGPQRSGTIVALGDSITDAAASTSQEVRGWPGQLALRLAKAAGKVQYGVSNQGIGGNRLLQDGIGVNALARFDRDVASQPNASYVIVLEGINDIGIGTGTFNDFRFEDGKFSSSGRAVTSGQLIAAYQQLIARAHAQGLKIIGGTLLPFGGSFYFSAEREQVRLEVNSWIRNSGGFDAVIDFERAVRDKTDPSRMAEAYDSGDKLHPSDAGYAAMANAIDLKLFAGAL